MSVSSSAASYTLNVGAVGVVGSFMGMPLDAMILGAVAGAVIHGLSGATTRSHGLVTIITSTLLAGAFSPTIVGWLIHDLNFGNPESEASMLKPLVPVVIGACWPWLAPMVHQGAKQVFDALVGRIVKLVEFFGGTK